MASAAAIPATSPRCIQVGSSRNSTELSLLLNVLCMLCNASLRIIFKHYPDETMQKEAFELSEKLNKIKTTHNTV